MHVLWVIVANYILITIVFMHLKSFLSLQINDTLSALPLSYSVVLDAVSAENDPLGSLAIVVGASLSLPAIFIV